MTDRYRVIYCLNQFFAGLGGEEKASLPPSIIKEARGPGILLQKLFPNTEVMATVIFGDNYVTENTAGAVREILALIESCFASAEKPPHLLLAEPAFNAGRYGLACGAVCKAVREHFNIPAVTAMFPENPAVNEYKKHVIIARSGADVMTLEDSVKRMGFLGFKLLHREEILPDQDEYIPQGRRRNFFTDRPGAVRAVDMLLSKLRGEPFVTEYPMPVFDVVS
ncbi:MAG: glycine/betaine/sarcosine/D-proline family reductase selenoprotein B [Desulfobulbales bacterium]